MLKAKTDKAAADAEKKRQHQQKLSTDRATKQQAEVAKASHALVVKAKGISKELSIGNLLTLIKWTGGQVIADPPLPLLRLSTRTTENLFGASKILEESLRRRNAL